MHPTRIAFPLVVLVSTLSAACSGDSPTSPTQTSTVSAITITGANSVEVGRTSSLTATARRNDGTTADVTATATWQSSNPAVARVDAAGVVSAVAAGSAVVSAAMGAVSGQLPIQVTAVDNLQDVTLLVERILVHGTCDENSLFETREDGEFSFRFELIRGGDRTVVWGTDREPLTPGTHLLPRPGLTFRRNITRGDDFRVEYFATEHDGLLGADPRLAGGGTGRSHVFVNGAWSDGRSLRLGSDVCGASVFYSLASRRVETTTATATATAR